MTKFTENRKKPRPITKPVVIFYHADCTDGFSAAWAAWKKFGNKAQYVATFHDDPLPKGLAGKEIYTLDLTFREPVTRKLLRTARRLTAVDHHISAKATTMLTYKHSYALHHSGAVLSWRYFHPGKPVPQFLLSVEDMDLWKFKLKGTRELFAYLELFDFDFRLWSRLAADFEKSAKRRELLKTGHTILRYQDRLIARQVSKNMQKVKMAGKTIYAANASGAFRSEMGNRLALLNPSGIGMVWRVGGDGAVVASLRSIGNADVAALAAKYGGGGHKHSSAFILKSLKDIPWKPVKR